MGVLSCVESHDGRSSGINARSESVYVRTFDLETSGPHVGPRAVRMYPGLPQIGQTYDNGLLTADPDYEEDLGAYVNEVQVEPASNSAGIGWRATVNYGPLNTAEFSGDPTLWRIRVQFGGERVERVVDFDRQGHAIMNSAYDRFGDPITVDDHFSTMIITRNEFVTAFSLSLASAYSDTVNKFAWNGFGVQYCKMGIITTSEEKQDPVTTLWYYTVTYPVSIGKKPWRKILLDQGYNELKAGKSCPIQFQGQPVSEARPLNGSGIALTGVIAPEDLVQLPFDVFDEADWAGLNINLSLRLGV